MTEDQLCQLLRTVKRHEQPREDYFDVLLRDIHRRQRSDFLRVPLWRIGLDRMHTFFGEHSMTPVSFAGAMALVVAMGLAGIGYISPSKAARPASSASAASENRTEQYATAFPAANRQASAGSMEFAPAAATQQRRYIIDARPVSYERSSFSF